MVNARGKVAFIIDATSAELPSMFRMLKFDGNSLSASRRLPPSCSVAGSWGLTSLVVPIEALLPAGGARLIAGEHAVSAKPATRARILARLSAFRARDCVHGVNIPRNGTVGAVSAPRARARLATIARLPLRPPPRLPRRRAAPVTRLLLLA